MMDKELKDKITKILQQTHLDAIRQADVAHTYDPNPSVNQIDECYNEDGYVSPEECEQCQQRQVESEKILSRETAYDERFLRDEVKEWKQRYDEAGGR